MDKNKESQEPESIVPIFENEEEGWVQPADHLADEWEEPWNPSDNSFEIG